MVTLDINNLERTFTCPKCQYYVDNIRNGEVSGFSINDLDVVLKTEIRCDNCGHVTRVYKRYLFDGYQVRE